MFDIMYSRYILNIAAFSVIAMMDVVYFAKSKSSVKIKHKMFSNLIINNTIVLFIELIIMVVFWLNIPFNICLVFLKLRDLALMSYFTILLLYYYSAVNEIESSSVNKFLTSEKILRPHFIFTIIVIIAHMFLPYNFVTKETFNTAFGGPAFYLTIAYCVITTLETLCIIIFKSKKEINFSVKLSLIWLFTLMMVILIFQTAFNDIAIMGLVSSVYVLGVYFIFENPDLELVEEIDLLTNEVERANNTKLNFLSNVSKEMYSPINTIVGLTDDILTNENITNEQLYNNIKQIEDSSKSFLEIINNTLDISNVESEKDSLNEKNYSLKTILDDIKTMTNEKLTNSKVTFKLNVDESIPNNLYGDSTKIYQILFNIVSNSIKFTEVGKINLTLNKEIKNNNITLKFKISDTGIGIKDEDFNKIFEKYFKLNENGSEGTSGTGLGLAIAKNYVDLLDGQIWFDSVYGAGTTFYIEIPQRIIDITPTLADYNINTDNVNEIETILDCSKYRVLIVEDDTLSLDVTKRLFQRYGFEVVTCSNGKECIFRYKKGEHYDMILINHIMPEMSGIEVIRIIRKLNDYKAPPMVALTANAFTGSRDLYLKEGFDDYLSKPIDMLELDTLINRYFK